MRVCRLLSLFLLSSSAALCADLVIRNVVVVDVQSGVETPHSSLLIRNGKIQAVGTQVATPASARVVDGGGRFAIPGLWDMHVHLWYRENQFPLFLANGVTGVRDMGSDLNWVNQWRDEMKAGKLLGPHVETCGPAVDGAPSGDEKLPTFVVRGPNDARDTFDRLDDLGVDFVKVLSGVPRDAYFALVERARKYDLPVAGHVPPSVTLDEAIDARQKSVEHMTGILMACSSQEARLRGRQTLALEKSDRAAYRAVRAEALATFDAKKADELFRRMALFSVREVPTLTMLRRAVFLDDEFLAASAYLPYVSKTVRRDWADPREEHKKMNPETLEEARSEYEKLRSLIPAMRRAGVELMAGTDTGDAYTFPGFDLHRELELLVEAGLTPLEALRSATIVPAKFLEADEAFGSLEVGRTADVVLLDADPLKDIRNTRKIHAVMVGGRYLAGVQLSQMLRKY